jgi:hypothetical protein
MHAVIVIPPLQDFYTTPHRCSSLGAHILKQRIEKLGCTVSLHNFLCSGKKNTRVALPEPLSYLKRYLVSHETGKLSYFTQYHHFGTSIANCAAIIAKESPSLCFISCFAFSYAQQTIELAEAIKSISSEITIVVGGSGPSAYPEYFIRRSSIDYVLTGEAEVSIQPFLSFFLHKLSMNPVDVPNLYWKKQGIVTQPVMVSATNRNDIDVTFVITGENRDTIFLSTSVTRGCSRLCGFCSNFITHGRHFRTAPFETIEIALKKFLTEHTIGDKHICINFEDDNLLIDSAYLLQLMHLCKEYFGNVSYLAENGIDYSMLTPELVDTLINAGMSKFNLSLASASAKSLEGQNRYLDLEHYHSVVKAIANRGIPCITYFICGLKNDTRESIAHTLRFLLSEPVTIGISLFYAVPGIAGFEKKAMFDTIAPCCCCGSSAYPWNKELSTLTLITAFRISRYINLIKQDTQSADERELITIITKEQRLYTLIKSASGQVPIPVPYVDDELVMLFFSANAGECAM